MVRKLEEFGVPFIDTELNALSATLAVIRWKKYLEFYADLEGEHFAKAATERAVSTLSTRPFLGRGAAILP